MSVVSKKMCLIGDFGVGKTSLIRRFVDRQFSDRYLSTVGVKISRKLVEIESLLDNPQSLQLLIWDIEGNTKFKAIVPNYLQGAKGSLIVADVTRWETIEHISEHINLFCSINPKGVLVIALNKADLVDEEKLIAIHQSIDFQENPQVIGTFTTSAKTGENVDQIFNLLAQRMLEPI